MITVLTIILWWIMRNKNNSYHETGVNGKLPGNWQKVGEVSKLTIFPLKSARAISLQKGGVSSLGLTDIENPHLQLSDREFIVYDSDKKTAISGLVKSKIVLMAITPVNVTTLKFSFSGEQDFHLTWPLEMDQVVELKRWWGETVLTVDCGEDIARWVSQCLLNTTTGLRVGHFSHPTVALRTVTNGWTQFAQVYPNLQSQYLAYSYMASYHLITEESVAELNSRLSQTINDQQFRANVTIKGAAAFVEDSWDWIRLGDQAVLHSFKPCTRCAVTAINPETGKLDPNLEPLRMLKKFRQLKTQEERELSGSEPMFGLYAGMHTSGVVAVGDPVYVSVD